MASGAARVGERFGSLVVTHARVQSELLCRCDCGAERVVPARRLRSGGVKSCGCAKRRNLTGCRFGMLVAVRALGPGRGRSLRWECLCDCGATCSASSPVLRKGDKLSCGCSSRKLLSATRLAVSPVLDRYIPEPNTGCWLWCGTLNQNGYGKILRRVHGEVSAHRLFWTAHRGPIPDGLWVLHRCDTPACVNPAHLFLGTIQDNTYDMIAKGRAAWQKKAS